MVYNLPYIPVRRVTVVVSGEAHGKSLMFLTHAQDTCTRNLRKFPASHYDPSSCKFLYRLGSELSFVNLFGSEVLYKEKPAQESIIYQKYNFLLQVDLFKLLV